MKKTPMNKKSMTKFMLKIITLNMMMTMTRMKKRKKMAPTKIERT